MLRRQIICVFLFLFQSCFDLRCLAQLHLAESALGGAPLSPYLDVFGVEKGAQAVFYTLADVMCSCLVYTVLC